MKNGIAGIGCKVGIVLLLVALMAGGVYATPANPFSSNLVSSSGFSNSLVATVTEANGLYHYEYVLDFANTYVSGTGRKSPLTIFSVDNILNLEYTNAGNSAGLVNPTYGLTSSDSVYWAGSSVQVGQTVKFWYDSVFSFREGYVTMSSGRNSDGTTLCMVPEPGSILCLCSGLVGLGGLVMRKRSK